MAAFDQVLQALRPGASYSNSDSTLARVVWEDGVTPPTQAEYDARAAAAVSGDGRPVERRIKDLEDKVAALERGRDA